MHQEIFLKPKDIIVALDNQFYTFGEKQLIADLKELKKNNQKSILSVLRDETFFNLTVENSLGCKFVTTTNDETKKIKSDYSLTEVYEPDQLKEFIGLRDVYRNYDVIENSNSLLARIFSTLLASILSEVVGSFSVYCNNGNNGYC